MQEKQVKSDSYISKINQQGNQQENQKINEPKQNDIFHDIRLTCIKQNDAFFYCSECDQNAILCSNVQCKCFDIHHQCETFQKIKNFHQKINSKIKSKTQILRKVHEITQKMKNQIQQLQEFIQEQLETFGLHQVEKSMFNKIKRQSEGKDNLTGKFIMDYNRQKITIQKNSWVNGSVNKFAQKIQEISWNVNNFFDEIQDEISYEHAIHSQENINQKNQKNSSPEQKNNVFKADNIQKHKSQVPQKRRQQKQLARSKCDQDCVRQQIQTQKQFQKDQKKPVIKNIFQKSVFQYNDSKKPQINIFSRQEKQIKVNIFQKPPFNQSALLSNPFKLNEKKQNDSTRESAQGNNIFLKANYKKPQISAVNLNNRSKDPSSSLDFINKDSQQVGKARKDKKQRQPPTRNIFASFGSYEQKKQQKQRQPPTRNIFATFGSYEQKKQQNSGKTNYYGERNIFNNNSKQDKKRIQNNSEDPKQNNNQNIKQNNNDKKRDQFHIYIENAKDKSDNNFLHRFESFDPNNLFRNPNFVDNQTFQSTPDSFPSKKTSIIVPPGMNNQQTGNINQGNNSMRISKENSDNFKNQANIFNNRQNKQSIFNVFNINQNSFKPPQQKIKSQLPFVVITKKAQSQSSEPESQLTDGESSTYSFKHEIKQVLSKMQNSNLQSDQNNKGQQSKATTQSQIFSKAQKDHQPLNIFIHKTQQSKSDIKIEKSQSLTSLETSKSEK